MTNTTRVPFHPCSDGKQRLFVVSPGVPTVEALNCVYSLLEGAETLALQLNDPQSRDHERVSHLCQFVISAATAAVQSCIEGMPEAPEVI